MKNQVGYQVGLKSMMPMKEDEIKNMLRLSIGWQDLKGPCVIFVDEPFYDFLFRAGLEEFYQDVIPIPEEINTEDGVVNYADTIFPETVFLVSQYLSIDDLPPEETHGDSLPDKIQSNWRQLLDNELIISSLHNLDEN